MLVCILMHTNYVLAEFKPEAAKAGDIPEEVQQDIQDALAEEQREGIYREGEEVVAPSEEVVEETSDDTEVTEDEVQPEQMAEQSSDDGVNFDIWEYRVEGNNLLGRDMIERTVYPHLGPKKTIDDVELARVALETAYRNNGYGTVFVDIPEQDVENGVVILNVTEGKIDRVAITGSRYYSLGKIREQVPAIQEGQTPYLPEVQKQLADLNKGVAGRVITPVLRPGKTPGKVEVELKVQDEFPLHGSVELNDRYTADTNELRLNANVRYDNLWQLGHSASVGYVVAPEDRDEVEVIFGTYLVRFPGSNNLLAFYAVDSSSDVATTGEINQIGNGNIVGGRAIFPLPNLDRFTHSVTFGADYKDFDETTRLLGVDALNTPVSYISFITSYSANWFHERGRTTFTADGHFAPRAIGNTEKEFENKRAGAKPNFAILKASLEHTRELYLDSLLKLKFQAQIADSPLISNEQFSAGGLDTVRGYLESQQLGDDAYLASIEVQSPSLAKYVGEYVGEYLNDFRFKAFAEGARLKIQQPLPDQVDRFTLASIGAGMDLTAFRGFNAEFLWAMALNDNDDIQSGDSRLHFKVGYEF